MNQQMVNKLEEKGLSCPFVIAKTGETTVSEKNSSLKAKLSQMGTVIYESIGAVGRIKIETIEILGKIKGLIMEVEDEHIVGGLFDQPLNKSIPDIYALIKDTRSQAKPVTAPEAKPKVQFSPVFLDELKAILLREQIDPGGIFLLHASPDIQQELRGLRNVQPLEGHIRAFIGDSSQQTAHGRILHQQRGRLYIAQGRAASSRFVG